MRQDSTPEPEDELDSTPEPEGLTVVRFSKRGVFVPVSSVGPAAPALVDGFIHRGTINTMYANTGAFKTFTIIDMGQRIARGWPVYGRESIESPVLFIVGEGEDRFAERIEAWEEHHGVKRSPNLLLHLSKVNFRSPEDVAALADFVADQQVKVVFVDTLHEALYGESDTSDAAIGQVYMNARMLFRAQHENNKLLPDDRGAFLPRFMPQPVTFELEGVGLVQMDHDDPAYPAAIAKQKEEWLAKFNGGPKKTKVLNPGAPSVFFTHHTNRDGKFRGHGLIKDEADLFLKLTRSGLMTHITADKHRNGIEEQIQFHGLAESIGDEMVVINPAEAGDEFTLKIVRALREEDGQMFKQLQESTDIAKGTLSRHLRKMVTEGRLLKEGEDRTGATYWLVD